MAAAARVPRGMLRRSRGGAAESPADTRRDASLTMNAPRHDPTPPPERGDALGYALIAVLAALTIGALRAGGETKSLLMGLLLIAWGCMFLAAYYFSHKTFFLRGLLWFCTHWSWPSSPKMAFFYFAVPVAMGIVSILMGLGVV